MATYFVSASGGNDANDGLDNTGVGLAGANWTEGTFTLTENGHGYTFATGDVIYITAGAGATVGLYEVASSTVNTIILVETSTLPTVGNASDFAAGDLAGADITSASGPKLTITGSEDIAVAAGDHVWIRGGTDYAEEVTLDVGGAAYTSFIVWRGYTTTLDDNGRFVIDGNGNATCVKSAAARNWRMFINMEVKSSTDLVDLANTTAAQLFRNCYFHDSAKAVDTIGIKVAFSRCIFETLTGNVISAGLHAQAIACVFKGCTGARIFQADSLTCIGCLFYDVGANTVAINVDFDLTGVIAYNTMYGVKTTTDTAIDISAAGVDHASIFNNIITNWTTGIEFNTDWTEGWNIGFNNVLYSNDDDYTQNGGATSKKYTHTGEQTSNPSLTNPGADDYTIPSAGSAFGTGLSGFDTDGTTSNTNIGAFTPSGGGGGLLMPNKRGGKQ